MSRYVSTLALASAALLAGCGGSEDDASTQQPATDVATVEKCFTAAKVEALPPDELKDTMIAFSPEPDLHATWPNESNVADVWLADDESAADEIRGQVTELSGAYAENIDDYFVQNGSAIAVFDGEPTDDERDLVASCLSA